MNPRVPNSPPAIPMMILPFTASGAPGVCERTSDIMARERQASRKTEPVKFHRHGQPSVQNLPSNPSSPNTASWPPPTNSVAPPPEAPQALGLNFTGVTLADTLSFPPDTLGAAGPSQFIIALNGRFRSFNKSTGRSEERRVG